MEERQTEIDRLTESIHRDLGKRNRGNVLHHHGEDQEDDKDDTDRQDDYSTDERYESDLFTIEKRNRGMKMTFR